ncbi:MAG TPA: DNA ligase D [Alphaproteobacteria bacterium]|nr:DNA ligase D [Alphaproteobacteria bacterium]
MARSREPLAEYQRKRDFSKTTEPSGTPAARKQRTTLSFVVQKHAARRLHYDFRLELDGVLKSWAVTKGPSNNPADKRLAVRVEDHPLEYGGFEGTIPKGEYGGGTVMLWDRGTWEPIGDPHEGLEQGELKFRLHGRRLKGEWVLVHMKGRDSPRQGSEPRENWLLIKHRDEYARETDGLTERFTTSVETGRDMADIEAGLKPRRKAARAAPSSRIWTREGEISLPAFRPPQLATLVTDIPSGDDWLFETKYDGYRALAAIAGTSVRIYTRNGNDWTDKFARLVPALQRITRGAALIDGEICAVKNGRTDFSSMQDAFSAGTPLVYYAFDLLELDGEPLEQLPLLERKERLRPLLGRKGKAGPVYFSDHVIGHGEEVFRAMCDAHQEGVIAKRIDAPYRHERTRTWLKIKCIARQEFVIGGWRPSDKKQGFASLLLGTWEDGKLIYRGRVGTGFNARSSAEIRAELDARARATSPFASAPRAIARHARWVEPELVGEVEYTEMTPEGHLRHPSFVGLRRDKAAASVRLETPSSPPAVGKRATKRKSAAKLRAMNLTDEMGIKAAQRLGVKLSSPDRLAYPDDGITKARLVAYYAAVAERMLQYVAERPLSLVRAPSGVGGERFFQKHDKGTFPDEIKRIPIKEKLEAETKDHMYVTDAAGLVALVQMNTLEFHIWGARISNVEKAERIIFDIDPDEGLDFAAVRAAARSIREALGNWGLKSFPMLTGGKGIHVIAPLRAITEWPLIKDFCHAFADRLEQTQPDRFTSNIRKVKRKGRMFVDYLRNERGATAIAPFSTRARAGCPCAVPISWDELDSFDRANVFTLELAARRAREKDPWPDYFELGQSITRSMVEKAVGDAR